MKSILMRIRPYRIPLAIAGLCVLAFGPMLPWLGFYWDDWPLVWFYHRFGAASYLDFAAYRPVSGWLYTLAFSLLGESPLAWHLYALLWRALSALAFYWLLRLLWPRARRTTAAATLAFALYPGFSQQSIAVTYSQYFLYYTLFLASLGLMLQALRSGPRRGLYTVGALFLAAGTMLSTEYFYGLELLRPLLIWMALREAGLAAGKRRRRALKAWLPYALLLLLTYDWRYWAAQQPGSLYEAGLLDALIQNPLAALGGLLATMLGDWLEAAVLAWGRVAAEWSQLQAGSRVALAYFPVALAAAGLAAWALWPRDEAEGGPLVWREPLGLGAAAMLVGGLSFWVAELPLRLDFPFDRFTLPMSFGASLLLGGAWAALLILDKVKVGALALLLGLAAGFHFLTANAYRVEWEAQRVFFQQLAWRAPSLAENTALVTSPITALPHYTDNSLTAPLNWMYSDAEVIETLPYGFFYAGLRGGSGLARLPEGGSIEQGYRYVSYTGDAGDVVVLFYAPPACLRALEQTVDGAFPRLPADIADLVHLSHPDLLLAEAGPGSAEFPYWDAAPQESWCYYFEKADLSRQIGDWTGVAAYGDVAFALDDSPNHASERTPFIEGYAHVGDWTRAVELSAEMVAINPLTRPMLCRLWARIEREAGASTEKNAALERVVEIAQCG